MARGAFESAHELIVAQGGLRCRGSADRPAGDVERGSAEDGGHQDCFTYGLEESAAAELVGDGHILNFNLRQPLQGVRCP